MKKIMIVDDAAFMRMCLRNILERAGFEVIAEASNGIEAVNKYFILRPEIVTMDITMPEMDGIDATAEIKKQDPSAKIVIISSLGQEAWVRKAIRLGAKGFIVKPYKEQYIIDTLNNI